VLVQSHFGQTILCGRYPYIRLWSPATFFIITV